MSLYLPFDLAVTLKLTPHCGDGAHILCMHVSKDGVCHRNVLESFIFCAIEMLFFCEMYILGYILIKVMRDFVGR